MLVEGPQLSLQHPQGQQTDEPIIIIEKQTVIQSHIFAHILQ